jgi:hypothetical protein
MRVVSGVRSMSAGRIERAHAAFDIDALFPDAAPTTAVPWPVASARVDAVEREMLHDLLSVAPRADQFVELDPRQVHASQSGLTRAGVEYYLTGEYRRSGRTYAAQFDVGNKYPVVRERAGKLVLLGGHHRCAAALLEGEPLLARLVAPVLTGAGEGAVVVTPSLVVCGSAPGFVCQEAADRGVAEVWINMGERAWLPVYSHHAVTHLLRELAVTEDWLRHQLHYAWTGRIRLPAVGADHSDQPARDRSDGSADRPDGELS